MRTRPPAAWVDALRALLAPLGRHHARRRRKAGRVHPDGGYGGAPGGLRAARNARAAVRDGVPLRAVGPGGHATRGAACAVAHFLGGAAAALRALGQARGAPHGVETGARWAGASLNVHVHFQGALTIPRRVAPSWFPSQSLEPFYVDDVLRTRAQSFRKNEVVEAREIHDEAWQELHRLATPWGTMGQPPRRRRGREPRSSRQRRCSRRVDDGA